MTIAETGPAHAFAATPAQTKLSWLETLRLSLKIALRELRSGLQGFYVFLSCLTLGVAAIAAIGSFSSAIESGLSDQGRTILGGDVELRLAHRRNEAEKLAWLQAQGTVVEVATLRAMVTKKDKTDRALVELKASGSDYPLFGEVELTNNQPLPSVLEERKGQWGLVADPALAERLGIKIGDELSLGKLTLRLRGLIKREPDRVSGGFFFGPRVMLSKQALMQTELVQPGSLVYWHYKIKLNAGASTEQIAAFQKRLETQFPDEGWRFRSRDNAAPGTKRFIDRLVLFLSLVGLTALIVGGLGIGNAVNNFLEARRRNIAMLKCIGAPAQSIFQIYMIQVLLLAGIGVSVGLVLGLVLPIILAGVLNDVLPLKLSSGVYGLPLLTATTFGFLITVAFALWPLSTARSLPATALFRSNVQPAGSGLRGKYLIAFIAAFLAIAALALASFPERLFTLFYFGGVIASFGILYAMARGLVAVARRMPRPRQTALRLAITNLHRPGAPTVSVVLSLGIGLALFVTLALLDANLTRELRQNLPEKAPAFFFMDIQPGELDGFKSTALASAGVESIDTVPMLRGRIKVVNGVAAKDVTPSQDSAWALRGDRGLTYAETPPTGSKVVAGEWWPTDYNGPPQVSFTKDIADGLGLKLGDSVTVNVLGRDIRASISSLREVEWESLGINFVMVFSPNALKAAPHTHLATIIMSLEHESALLGTLTKKFPTVTAVRVRDALDAVSDLLGKLLFAVRGSNGITLLVGILVLAGAMATGLKSRIYDSVILKTLGATRKQLVSAHALEYALLGALTSLFAVAAGAAASWGIVRFLMGFDWAFEPLTASGTVIFASALTVIAGFAATWRALTAKVAPILRVD
ncbi:MAG: FtsX-like permease family protein [Alphaproteobacteria bacterium]|nr:FtsX-like permease family protein [Alphaproteobacteria bacterium]